MLSSLHESQSVKSIEIEHGICRGIITEDNKFVAAKAVLSNATPDTTYLNLVKTGHLPEEFIKKVKGINYDSGVAKINGNKSSSNLIDLLYFHL